MLRHIVIAAAACSTPAFAGLVSTQLAGDITVANGLFSGLKAAPNSILLDLNADENSSANSPTIGGWTLSVLDASDAVIFSATGNGRRSSMTFSTVMVDGISARRYTMVLSGVTSASGGLGANPTQYQFSYIAKPISGSTVGTFGDSLRDPSLASRGSISVVASGASFGMFGTNGFSVIPAPGAAAVLAAAGLLTSRRRGMAA
jgi:hypothetical protein